MMNSGWELRHAKIKADETQHDLRRALDECVFPYIPKARQQRSGLLIDFLNFRGVSTCADIIDLLMLGENRFGVLLAHLPTPISASLEDLSLVKTALRDQKTSNSSSAALRALDHFFSENFQSDVGVKAFYVLFNQYERKLNFSSAGHSAMLLYRPSTRQIYRLNTDGGEIGIAARINETSTRINSHLPKLKSEEASLLEGDLLVLCSNGLLSAKNAWGEEFGFQRLIQVIRKHGHKQPTPFLVELQNALEAFTLGETEEADATVIAMKNMLPPPENDIEAATDYFSKKFLTIEEEDYLWQVAEKHPDAGMQELTELLGDRYSRLERDRIHSYLYQHMQEPSLIPETIGYFAKPKILPEKSLQKRLLQAFPTRQLVFKKYEFRGNTQTINHALECYQNGRYQDSLIEFMKVRKVIADSESVFCFFGNLYLLLNMSIKAKHEFLRALKINNRCVHAWLALAYISLLHEDYDGTIQHLSTAIRLDENLNNFYDFLILLISYLDEQNAHQEWIS